MAAARTPETGLGRFVGRQRELARLDQLVAMAAEGRSSVALIAASSGMGATRCLDEAIDRWHAAGLPISVARSDAIPAWRGRPFGPVAVAVEHLLSSIDTVTLAALAGPSWDALIPVLPGLSARLGRIHPFPPAPDLPPIRRAERTREAIRGLITRLAERTTVVLVIEDLHVADAATRDLVAFLARTVPDVPLLLVGTYQPDTLERGHPLRATLAAIDGGPRPAERIELGPLSRSELGALVESIEGERPSAPALLLVSERSGGSPLVAEEVLAARRELSGATLTAPLTQLVSARAARRSPECRRVLRSLALATGPLRSEALAAVLAAYDAGQPRPAPRSAGRPLRGGIVLDGELTAGVAEAVAAGFLRVTSDHLGDALTVRHELIGEALAADLLPVQRRRMHAALAGALADHPTAAEQHWLAAFVPDRARSAALAAATEAELAGSGADALAHLERAIALGAADEPRDPIDDGTSGADGAARPDAGARAGVSQVALLVRASDAAAAAGDPARAAAFLEAALARAVVRTDRPGSAHLLEKLGAQRWDAGDRDGALDAYARALELLPVNADADRARVLGLLAQVRMLEGMFTEAAEHAAEAVRCAERAGPIARASLGHARCTIGVIDGWQGRSPAALDNLQAALAIAAELDRPEDAFRARANLATVFDLDGRREEALAVARDGIGAAERAGLEAVHGNLLRGNAADFLFNLGRWREAQAMAAQALAWAPAGLPFVNAALASVNVDAEMRAGDGTARLLGRLFLELETIADTQFAVPAYQASASLSLWNGDVDDARRSADAAWSRIRETEDWALAARSSVTVLAVAIAAAEQARAARDLAGLAAIREQATAVVREARAMVDRSGVPIDSPARLTAAADLDEAEASLERVAGRDRPAHWARVAETWLRLRRPYAAARAFHRQAVAILDQAAASTDRRERRDDAREPLLQAAGIAAELGALPLLGALRELSERARITLPPHVLTAMAAGETDAREERARRIEEAGRSESRLPSPAGLVSPPAGQATETFGLSARERGVLAEIVAGRTNREIGERLYISEKTVHVHVGNILAKLGVGGRVEAATVALRLGLVTVDAAGTKRPGPRRPGPSRSVR